MTEQQHPEAVLLSRCISNAAAVRTSDLHIGKSVRFTQTPARLLHQHDFENSELLKLDISVDKTWVALSMKRFHYALLQWH